MRHIVLFAILAICVLACSKHNEPPKEKPVYSWVEEFDTLQTALDSGWVVINNSRPLGSSSWAQGSFVFTNGKISGFPAASYRYSGNDYVTCGFNCGGDDATLSAWLITPSTMVKNGDTLYFHTRTTKYPANYADRMQVRLNDIDDDTDVGNGPVSDMSVASATGKFNKLLLDINPGLELSGENAFPGKWQGYAIPVSGLAKEGYHRFAFRYFVVSGGPGGTNSDGIGLDSVAFVSK